MKICFIGDASSYHVSKWVRYFAREHDVHVISTGAAEIPGVTVHWLPNPHSAPGLRHLYYWRYFQFARRVLRTIKPNLVHALQINIYAALAKRAGGRPFVVTPFGGDVLINPNRSSLGAMIARYCLRNVDLITVDAEHIKPALVRLGADARLITRICFGIDTAQYSPGPAEESVREMWGVGDAPVVISLRHLMPIYDIGTLIRAVPLVLNEVPEARFVIVGKGPEEDRLREMVASLGIEQNVHFAGWMNGSDLPKALRSADIYVSTSLSDAGLASSTGEAMACALPAVVTDFGDNGLWVTDGASGFLFPVGSSHALADRLVRILRSPAEAKSMGDRGREVICRRNDWATEMKRMDSLYREFGLHENRA